MHYRQKKAIKKSRRRAGFIITVSVFVVIFSGFFIYNLLQNSNKNNTSITNPTEENINYSPPTTQEAESGDKKKVEVQAPNNSTTQPSNNSGKKTITPIISSAEVFGSNLEVSGYVGGIIEVGGSCTVVAKKDSATVSESQRAFDDAQYTSCGVIEMPLSKLTSGTWTITLSYESEKYSGRSSPTTRSIN